MIELNFRPRLGDVAILALLTVQALVLVFEPMAGVAIGLEFFFI